MIHLRVCVEWEIVIEFDYSWMVKFFVDSVFSTGVSEKTFYNLLSLLKLK